MTIVGAHCGVISLMPYGDVFVTTKRPLLVPTARSTLCAQSVRLWPHCAKRICVAVICPDLMFFSRLWEGAHDATKQNRSYSLVSRSLVVLSSFFRTL